MQTFLGINLHQRGQKATIIEVLNKYTPKKYIQIGYPKDLIATEDLAQNIEVISYNLNELQYGKIPNLHQTLPLDNDSIEGLLKIEGYCYLLLERIIHELYNSEYQVSSQSDKLYTHHQFDKSQQINSITPSYSLIDKKRFIYDNYRLLHHIFNTETIDFCFLSESPSSFIPYIGYHLSEQFKVKTILTEHIPCKGHRVFTTSFHKIGEEILDEYKQLLQLNDDIKFDTTIYKDEWERIINEKPPYYMKGKQDSNIIQINYTTPYKPSLISKIKKIGNLDYLHYKLKNLNHFNKSKELRNFYEELCEVPNLNQNFIYVALHLEPEKTSLPLGGHYGDQILMIEMLSYHLPEGYTIYVKENPKQLSNYRSTKYYLKILSLPNVKLVSTSFNSFDLINNAKAVATLTGTVAYEAMAKGKPAFVFGYTILQHFEQTWVVRNNKDCLKYMNMLKHGSHIIDSNLFKTFFKALENIGLNLPYYKENNLSEKEFLESMKLNYIKFIDQIIKQN